MDLLLHVSSADALPIALPLARALTRRNLAWGCFLTNDGVRLLDDARFVEALATSVKAAVCEHSWDRYMPGCDCPLERGSQTLNSALMGEAARTLSL